mmetsp:Transcript_84218/g.261975  ORF Transcript_84218/g.261975 Transcript_84218/m.261975 type:complete len:222 (-) Transcript_84218:240-905(-)
MASAGISRVAFHVLVPGCRQALTGGHRARNSSATPSLASVYTRQQDLALSREVSRPGARCGAREANIAPVAPCGPPKRHHNALPTRQWLHALPMQRPLAKMGQEPGPPALAGICQVCHRLIVECQHLPAMLPILLACKVLEDQGPRLRGILLGLHEGDALGIVSVAACSAALLHVVLQGAHCSVMDDPANRWLVDAHAKSDRRDHHLHLIHHESRMYPATD